MWKVIVFIYAPIVVFCYVLYDKIPLKDLGLGLVMIITFIMVSFMYYAMPYSPSVIVRTEGEPLPNRKQKIYKWFKERFLVFVSLVFLFESIMLVAWNLAKGFH